MSSLMYISYTVYRDVVKSKQKGTTFARGGTIHKLLAHIDCEREY